MWRFATSMQQPALVPPAFEAWETEIKTSAGEEGHEEKEEDKYASKISMTEFGEYRAKSEYTMKSEYTTKSEYK